MAEKKSTEGEGEINDPELDELLKEVQEPLLKETDKTKFKEAKLKETEEPEKAQLSSLLDGATDPLPTAAIATLVSPTEIVKSTEEIDNDISTILKKFHEIADKISYNYDCDRDEIEDTIDRLRQMFTPTSKGFIVESLVSALKTKADTNANFIKMLDAYAKFVAATKNTSIFQSNTTNIDIGDFLDRDED